MSSVLMSFCLFMLMADKNRAQALTDGKFPRLFGKWNCYRRGHVSEEGCPKGSGVKAMLNINLENNGEVLVLRCAGRIVAGEEVSSLKAAVLCHQDSKVILLDFAKVQMLDGAGMGLLAFLAGWTRVVGIRLKIRNPSRRVQELLELTNLDSVLEVYFAEAAPDDIKHPAAVSHQNRPTGMLAQR
jgi:anti-anti-sigma factor